MNHVLRLVGPVVLVAISVTAACQCQPPRSDDAGHLLDAHQPDLDRADAETVDASTDVGIVFDAGGRDFRSSDAIRDAGVGETSPQSDANRDAGGRDTSEQSDARQDATDQDIFAHADAGRPRDTGTLPDTAGHDAAVEVNTYVVTTTSGAVGDRHSGPMPAGDPGSDTYIDPFNGNATFIPGCTNRFAGTLHGSLVASVLVGFEEMPDHYYGIPVSSTDFVWYVALGQNARNSTLIMVVIPVLVATDGQPAGRYGRPLRISCRVLQVGTGDLQVCVSWATDSDVDLHLVEPSGEEIYYGHRRAASGGLLDLDANSGCSFENPRIDIENITYQNTSPPGGHYFLRVDYWTACNVMGTTDFTVTINVRGTPAVFPASFVRADADYGGPGSGRTVAEFEF